MGGKIKYIWMVILSLTSVSALATVYNIKNNLPRANEYCKYGGNTVKLFYSNNQPDISPGGSLVVDGDFSKKPYGLGIQVNNWYWVATRTPVQKGPPQNPDNSGAQFMINSDCEITSKTKPVYGSGIETYLIANVTSAKGNSGECIISIDQNTYTNAVTPTCCAPPGIGSNTCVSSQWGETSNGKNWPPK